MTNKKILTIAIEVGKLDECLEIYNLIEILMCGNRSISGKIDSEPLNYYKNNAIKNNNYFSNNSTARRQLFLTCFTSKYHFGLSVSISHLTRCNLMFLCN